MRRSFSCQIRQKEQTLASGRDLSRLVVQNVIGVFLLRSQLSTKLVAKPLQRAAASQRDTHHVPLASDCVTESVQPPKRIDFDVIGMNKHDSARPDRSRQRAATHHAGSNSVCRTVSCSANDNTTGRQTKFFGGLFGKLPRNVFGFIAATKQVDIQTEF